MDPSSSFLIQKSVPTRITYGSSMRRGSIPFTHVGQPAIIVVGGIEWASKIPRNALETEQINTWAEKLSKTE